MMRVIVSMLVCLLALPVIASASVLSSADDERREFQQRALLGQIDFLVAQGNYYSALQLISDNELLGESDIRKLLKARQREHGNGHMTLAEIEIAYRMNQRAGNAVREVLDANVEERKRNHAAYELARIYYRKSQYDYARFALQLIRGDLYYPFEHDVAYLEAMLDARTGKTQQAIEALDQLKGDKRTLGFARFNLAHLQLQEGEQERALANFVEVGQLQSDDDAIRALVDKANLVLGYHYLAQQDAANTVKYLSRVRLDSAFTSKALLGLAWTHMNNADLRSAIVPWTHLHARTPVDSNVLEATIALPYVYSKLGLHGKAATLYQQAVEKLQQYQTWLQAAKAVVDDGGVLDTLLVDSGDEGIRASGLLVDLLASKRYQESVNNYRDLEQMISVLEQRQDSLAITRDMLEQRYTSYDADVLKLDASLTDIDSRLDEIRRRRDALDAVMDSHDTKQDQQARAATMVASSEPVAVPVVIAAATDGNSGQRRELDALMQQLMQRRDNIRTRRDELTSYEEFMLPVSELSQRTARLLGSLKETQQQQRTLLRQMTDEALSSRLQLVNRYITTARYELAKSYDVIADQERGENIEKILELRTGDVISP